MRIVGLTLLILLLTLVSAGADSVASSWVGEGGTPAETQPLVKVFTVNTLDYHLSESGAPIPLTQWLAVVDRARLSVRLPQSTQPQVGATVRVEYELAAIKENVSQPVTLRLGFPINYPGPPSEMANSTQQPPTNIAIKWDGAPVAVRRLSFAELIAPTLQAWQKEIDRQLFLRPELMKEVTAVRATVQRDYNGAPDDASFQRLKGWLQENYNTKGIPCDRLRGIVYGLLGTTTRNLDEEDSWYLEEALAWLNPNYVPAHLLSATSHQWGHEGRFLDPYTSQLKWADQGWSFGVCQFEVKLEPGRQHKLVVQYRQPLGYCGSGGDGGYYSQGLSYVLNQVERWGGWGGITVDIFIPKDWREVSIRPAAKLIGTEKGMAHYQLEISFPAAENLYLGVVAEKTWQIWHQLTGDIKY